MKFGAAKLLATVVCLVSLLGVATAPAEACCFLNWLFGPCCGSGCGAAPCGPSYYGPSPCGPAGCAPTYGGCATGNCGTAAYYSPYAWSGCSSCGSACGTCDTGCSTGCSTGSCSGGDCGINSLSGPPPASPAPANDKWKKKTYTEEPADGSNPGGPADPNRTDSDSGLNKKETRYSPRKEGSGIEQTGGEAPGTSDAIPINPRQGPAVSEPEDAGSLPVLNLDEKVAWRSAPERKRLAGKPNVANARLIRRPSYPKSEWTPVDTDSKVARK